MGYEFTGEQNAVITNLAKYMQIAAVVTAIVGIVDLADAIVNTDIISLIFSFSIIAIGVTFYFPADNLKRIVKTEGSDIKELMQAFSDLNKGWTIVLGVLIIAMVISASYSILILMGY